MNISTIKVINTFFEIRVRYLVLESSYPPTGWAKYVTVFIHNLVSEECTRDLISI